MKEDRGKKDVRIVVFGKEENTMEANKQGVVEVTKMEEDDTEEEEDTEEENDEEDTEEDTEEEGDDGGAGSEKNDDVEKGNMESEKRKDEGKGEEEGEGDKEEEADTLDCVLESGAELSDGEVEDSEDDDATRRATKRHRGQDQDFAGSPKRFRLDVVAEENEATAHGAGEKDDVDAAEKDEELEDKAPNGSKGIVNTR